MTLREFLDLQFKDPFRMAVLSKPRTKEAAEKIRLRPIQPEASIKPGDRPVSQKPEASTKPYDSPVEQKKEASDRSGIHSVQKDPQFTYQAASYKGTQVFHQNFADIYQMTAFLEENLQKEYRQLQVQGQAMDGTVLVSKGGKITIRTSMHKEQKPIKITGHNRVKRGCTGSLPRRSGCHDKRRQGRFSAV